MDILDHLAGIHSETSVDSELMASRFSRSEPRPVFVLHLMRFSGAENVILKMRPYTWTLDVRGGAWHCQGDQSGNHRHEVPATSTDGGKRSQ